MKSFKVFQEEYIKTIKKKHIVGGVQLFVNPSSADFRELRDCDYVRFLAQKDKLWVWDYRVLHIEVIEDQNIKVSQGDYSENPIELFVGVAKIKGNKLEFYSSELTLVESDLEEITEAHSCIPRFFVVPMKASSRATPY